MSEENEKSFSDGDVGAKKGMSTEQFLEAVARGRDTEVVGVLPSEKTGKYCAAVVGAGGVVKQKRVRLKDVGSEAAAAYDGSEPLPDEVVERYVQARVGGMGKAEAWIASSGRACSRQTAMSAAGKIEKNGMVKLRVKFLAATVSHKAEVTQEDQLRILRGIIYNGDSGNRLRAIEAYRKITGMDGVDDEYAPDPAKVAESFRRGLKLAATGAEGVDAGAAWVVVYCGPGKVWGRLAGSGDDVVRKLEKVTRFAPGGGGGIGGAGEDVGGAK